MPSAVIFRRGIVALWCVLFCAVVGLVAVTRVAPLMDRQAIVIRGGSMEPTLPLGSLVLLRPTATGSIRPGDLVTFGLPSGVLVTHRVLRVADLPDGRYLETKGDRNAAPDPVLVSAPSTIGVVDVFVPVAGFLVAYLSLPTGILSTASLLMMLLLATALLVEGESTRTRRSLTPKVRLGT